MIFHIKDEFFTITSCDNSMIDLLLCAGKQHSYFVSRYKQLLTDITAPKAIGLPN